MPGSTPRRFTRPKTVTHPGINWAGFGVTTLVKTNVRVTTKPNWQLVLLMMPVLLLLLLVVVMIMMIMMMMMCHIYRVKTSHHQLTNMPPSIGGPEVDSVIIAAFAALVWHTPTLRRQISRYGTNTFFSPDVALVFCQKLPCI